MSAPFHLFGSSHILALAVIAGAAVLLAALARHLRETRGGRVLRVALAAYLIVGIAGATVRAQIEFGWSPWDLVPLHLCDFAVLLAAYALVTMRPLASEWLYFWAFSATALALVTPDLDLDFPDAHWIVFFALHGGVVVAAAVLTAGFGMKPRPGAPWRIFLLTNAYAAVAAIVDVTFGLDFLYLRAKPTAPTLLDLLGPWPVYILAGEAIALAAFHALMLPFVRSAAPAPGGRAPSSPPARDGHAADPRRPS